LLSIVDPIQAESGLPGWSHCPGSSHYIIIQPQGFQTELANPSSRARSTSICESRIGTQRQKRSRSSKRKWTALLNRPVGVDINGNVQWSRTLAVGQVDLPVLHQPACDINLFVLRR